MSRPESNLRARAGYFETRRSSRHPWVAAHVTQDAGGRWAVTVDGVPSLEMYDCTSAEELYAECLMEGVNAFSHPLLSVFLFGREITKEQYDWRLAASRHAKINDPSHPAANPDKPIDLGTVPIASIF